MKKALKWIGTGVGIFVALMALALVVLAVYATIDYKQTLSNRPLYPITADMSPEGLARGKYLVEDAMGCTEGCHTPEGGTPLIGFSDEFTMGPAWARFSIPNLTPDPETGLGSWSDAEIARAIREGIDKAGIELVIMPSYNYQALSDADVSAIVGYLRNLSPVNNPLPEFEANLAAKMMTTMGLFGQDPVQPVISAPQVIPDRSTLEYGEYMLRLGGCSDCHQPDFAGGPVRQIEGSPVSSNLTAGGELADWSEGDFIRAVKEGIRPSGIPLSDYMPRYNANDDDLAAIYRYLMSLPAVKVAER